MPSVEVWNGDLEDALAHLRKTTEREELLKDYKKHLAYSSPSEKNRNKRFMAQYKQELKRRRSVIRVREAIRRDGYNKGNS